VFPFGVVVHGDPPLPVSGVIKDVIPRQRRFAPVLTERRLLENCAAFQNPIVVTGFLKAAQN
jgi:hypothetical protein